MNTWGYLNNFETMVNQIWFFFIVQNDLLALENINFGSKNFNELWLPVWKVIIM